MLYPTVVTPPSLIEVEGLLFIEHSNKCNKSLKSLMFFHIY